MTGMFQIETLHRRRLAVLEEALKQARADQRRCEEALAERRRDQETVRLRGLQRKRDIDATLLSRIVTRADVDQAHERLVADQKALEAARDRVLAAEADLTTAARHADDVQRCWRDQSAKVEKFGIVTEGLRDEHRRALQHREDMELEDIPRRQA